MQPYNFEQAQDFIWRNARLIDRYYFAYRFCNGPAEPVVAALKAYQNPDGGFGSALEPDVRAPSSQPIPAEEALKYLDGTGKLTDPTAQRELILPLCGWLEQVGPEGGIPFSLPTANAYPHQPWMQAEESPAPQINPTAAITGLLLKSGVQHPWLERAVDFCWRSIAESEDDMFHTIITEVMFLENAPDKVRAQPLLDRLMERVGARGLVEMDPSAAGYVKMPLDWAPQPNSFFRPLFDEAEMQEHLTALARRQRPDGGWPISWDALSPAAEAEWRAKWTIEALLTLRAYEAAGYEVK